MRERERERQRERGNDGKSKNGEALGPDYDPGHYLETSRREGAWNAFLKELGITGH